MKTGALYLKLPKNLLRSIDALIAEAGYTSRQEFVREVIRQAITQHRIQEFHKTIELLRKKVKVKRNSPILTKAEKDEIIKEYAKEKGWKL
jgi:metal-responsive CopG/Arc/MetJ family transcriptional regulator